MKNHLNNQDVTNFPGVQTVGQLFYIPCKDNGKIE